MRRIRGRRRRNLIMTCKEESASFREEDRRDNERLNEVTPLEASLNANTN